MTTANQAKLQAIVSNIVNSCKGTTWENESMEKLRTKLSKELNLRSILIEQLIANA